MAKNISGYMVKQEGKILEVIHPNGMARVAFFSNEKEAQRWFNKVNSEAQAIDFINRGI